MSDETVTTTIVFTGAPQAADYEYTKTLETFTWQVNGREWTGRKVAITTTPYRTAYQCDRYTSFLGGCPTLDDPRTHPIGTGRRAPTNFK